MNYTNSAIIYLCVYLSQSTNYYRNNIRLRQWRSHHVTITALVDLPLRRGREASAAGELEELGNGISRPVSDSLACSSPGIQRLFSTHIYASALVPVYMLIPQYWSSMIVFPVFFRFFKWCVFLSHTLLMYQLIAYYQHKMWQNTNMGNFVFGYVKKKTRTVAEFGSQKTPFCFTLHGKELYCHDDNCCRLFIKIGPWMIFCLRFYHIRSTFT